MRAVALSDDKIIKKIEKYFVPFKLQIEHGTQQFPLKWPALINWRIGYPMSKSGFTASTVVSPDLKLEYANTGSAMVWEMFESTAYDREKFLAMIERGHKRAEQEREIRDNEELGKWEKKQRLMEFRNEVRTSVRERGQMRLPPEGFSVEKALELFRLSGDLPEKKEKEKETETE